MGFQLRPWQVPDDFPRIAELITATRPEPVGASDLEEDEKNMPSDIIMRRLVAVSDDGEIMAYGYAERIPSLFMKGEWSVRVVVDPERRGMGAGRTLAAEMERFAVEGGAEFLRSNLRENDADALAFAQRRGYQIERHLFESTLDPAAFDAAPYAHVVPGLEAGGIRFFTMADEPGEATERKLYEFMSRTCPDIPGWDMEGFITYEQFQKWDLQTSGFRPNWCIMAADGDRLIGATLGYLRSQTGALYTGHTSVDREYRGRKVALALKLLSIETARRDGVPYMRTNNDSLNAPMLAVNRKLGYQPASGIYRMKKVL